MLSQITCFSVQTRQMNKKTTKDINKGIFKYIYGKSSHDGYTKAEISSLGIRYYFVRFLAFALMEASGLLS